MVFKDLNTMNYTDISEEYRALRKRIIEVELKLKSLDKAICIGTRKIDRYS